MSILDTVLNKGGAGVSLSRQETIEALDPLLRQHHRLNSLYRQALVQLPVGSEMALKLDEALRVARMDVGKLAECVLSAGGIPYSGTDLDPTAAPLPGGNALFRHLADAERDLRDETDKQLARDHQIRTQAILGNVAAHSRERLALAERAAQKPLDR